MGVLNIFAREVKSYFQSFIAYVVIAVFLLLAGYFFYADLIMLVMVVTESTQVIQDGVILES